MNFVTVFPNTYNFNLTKDVGMIPYVLQRNYGYHSMVVTYANDQYTYAGQGGSVEGLGITILKKKTGIPVIDGFLYILKNAGKIDILNYYHFSILKIILWAIPYKIINPKGIVYLKMDMDEKQLPHYSPKHKLPFFLRRTLAGIQDVISGESTKVVKEIKNMYALDVIYLPNGYFRFGKTQWKEKKKIFLTVGRIGAYQKNTESLLESFVKLYHHDSSWNLRLVGPIEPGFEVSIRDFFKENQDMNDCITFAGEINDKEALEEEYAQASIFILPSRWESFGLVLTEAMAFGCYIITTTGVPAAYDLLKDDSMGKIVAAEDDNELVQAMTLAAGQFPKDMDYCSRLAGFAEYNYSWERICKVLDDKFRELSHEGKQNRKNYLR